MLHVLLLHAESSSLGVIFDVSSKSIHRITMKLAANETYTWHRNDNLILQSNIIA